MKGWFFKTNWWQGTWKDMCVRKYINERSSEYKSDTSKFGKFWIDQALISCGIRLSRVTWWSRPSWDKAKYVICCVYASLRAMGHQTLRVMADEKPEGGFKKQGERKRSPSKTLAGLSLFCWDHGLSAWDMASLNFFPHSFFPPLPSFIYFFQPGTFVSCLNFTLPQAAMTARVSNWKPEVFRLETFLQSPLIWQCISEGHVGSVSWNLTNQFQLLGSIAH